MAEEIITRGGLRGRHVARRPTPRSLGLFCTWADQLIAFQRVVREGSFSRAARTLDIGQPAVSARIQALAAQLGGALLTRGRRIGLTPLGAGFLPFVERALDTLDEGVKSARLSQSQHRGRVTLGALGSLAGALLGRALVDFLGTHPDVECSMRSGDHEFVLQLLADGLVELGIIAWPCRDAAARELTSLLVMRERVLLVAHPRHPLGRRRSVSRAELVELGRPLLRLRWWPRHHPELTHIADATDSTLEIPLQAARHLALEGAAVGFFPETLVRDELAARTLVQVTLQDVPPIERHSALVRRSNHGPSRLRRARSSRTSADRRRHSVCYHERRRVGRGKPASDGRGSRFSWPQRPGRRRTPHGGGPTRRAPRRRAHP